MKLSDIIMQHTKILGEDKDIRVLAHNTHEDLKDGLFFCVDGFHKDGHNYAPIAVKKGAVAVVCERPLDLPENVSQVIVPSVREAMGFMAKNFYGDPARDMKVVMVTGTNGKTTTTHILKKIFEDAGLKVGLIGTNGTQIGSERILSNLTTPDPIELFSLLDKMKKAGCNIVCMEASAHALALHKLDAIKADVALITNITQDHLDFFGDMETYAEAKSRLFVGHQAKVGVFNIDDPYVLKLQERCMLPNVSFGIDGFADIIGGNIIQTEKGQHFEVDYPGERRAFDVNLDGEFNVYNCLGAITIAEILGIPRQSVQQSLSEFSPVEGRFNKVKVNGVNVIIDYAHTPDGMTNCLRACKQLAGDKRVISVFGCGGNRDCAKRPLMGRAAVDNSDLTIITSDNPRYENPKTIIEQICWGLSKDDAFLIEVDRERAIQKAISLARAGDVVAVLGKGSEQFIEKNGEKIPYTDKETIERML